MSTVFDYHNNLARSTVAVAPVPAAAGLSLEVAAGEGVWFTNVPFNVTVGPAAGPFNPATSEILRVTAVVGDVFTIVRAQEGITAKAIAVGWTIATVASQKVFTDIEGAVNTIEGNYIPQGEFEEAYGFSLMTMGG